MYATLVGINYIINNMSPEQYEYEDNHADRFHDYEEDVMQDDEYPEDWYGGEDYPEEYDEREDLGWDGGYED